MNADLINVALEQMARRFYRDDVLRNADLAASPDGVPSVHSWRPLDLIELGSVKPQPPDVGGLIYRRKRLVISGEDDAGKTMLLLGISADELRAGYGVVWVDTDDMGASMVLERLRGFGATDEQIRELFAYLHPEEALTDTARADVVALIAQRNARLLVNDAFNASLALHGLNPSSTEDVEAFWQGVVAPFCHAGAAVVLPDHVVKRRDERGRYAYGSERKATGSDVHLGLQVVDSFGRGKRGSARVTVHRDRVGFLPKPSPGLFVLDSDAGTGRLSWRLDPSQGVKGTDDEFRPTRLMERVSEYLERWQEPASRKQVETDVEGKAKWLRAAIDKLVEEDYAVEVPGERGARMVVSVRRFREADEWDKS